VRPFKPYIPAESREPEFTLKASLAGIVMAALFGAANAYLGMKAGQTVAATIPAAVIAIALFRLPFFRGGVLEQNLARTAASVGEALVAGAIFTIPAFMMVHVGGDRLWTDLRSHFWVGTLILLTGGVLGVFFIILLRRPLCVDLPDLPFPESTASAEVVKAGQGGAADAPKYVFGAMGLGALLQLLKDEKGLQVFKEEVVLPFFHFPRSAINYTSENRPLATVAYGGGIAYTTPAASPALLGIGYIIGPRLAAINFSGGVIAWLLLIPLVLFIDPDLPGRLGVSSRALTGAEVPWDVVSNAVWYSVVRPIAVGAMLTGTGYTLYSMRESILKSIRGALEASARGAGKNAGTRLDADVPIQWTIMAIAALVLPIMIIYQHFARSWTAAILAAAVMTVAGFFLCAVGGYLVGLVGSSNQPVSGLTLCALVIAAVVMVAIGMRGAGGVAAVLGVASVVCCATCTSGSLIQDLKAGYLLGGTPWKMEVAEVLSIAVVSFFLLFPIMWLHEANLATGGIGGRALPAPQAGLMAELAQGIVGGQMPWGLIVMGCALGVALIMIGAPSPMLIAVGMYLPLETTSAIFVGGLIKGLADIAAARAAARREDKAGAKAQFEERGTLLASGLIAGEAITGILLAVLFLRGIPSLTHLMTGGDTFAFVEPWGGWISLAAFALLAYVLIWIPIRKRVFASKDASSVL
jgi:putative OPT family oligopeptide transporter